MCRVLCLCDRLQGNVILPCMCIVSYIRLCVPHTCFMRWVPCAVFVCSGSNPAKIGATPTLTGLKATSYCPVCALYHKSDFACPTHVSCAGCRVLCAVFVCAGSNPAKTGATPHLDQPQGNVILPCMCIVS